MSSNFDLRLNMEDSGTLLELGISGLTGLTMRQNLSVSKRLLLKRFASFRDAA